MRVNVFTCWSRVILMMIDVVMHRQGRVTWRTIRFFSSNTLLSASLYLFWGCCFGDGGATILFYDHLELYGANAQNTYRRIQKSYCSQPIHTKRCYWAVFFERTESRTLESHESLVCLVYQVCQCLSWKTYTCWKNRSAMRTCVAYEIELLFFSSLGFYQKS